MCAISDAIMQMYLSHVNYPTTYHRAKVKQAREMHERHRRTCPECRPAATRTNYNAVTPRKTRMEARP